MFQARPGRNVHILTRLYSTEWGQEKTRPEMVNIAKRTAGAGEDLIMSTFGILERTPQYRICQVLLRNYSSSSISPNSSTAAQQQLLTMR